MSPRRLMLVVLAAALLALPEVGHAAIVRTVCRTGCDYTTLMAAIDASASGDGIEVMPGVYTEKVDVTKQVSISGPADGTRPVIQSSEPLGATLKVEAGAAGTTLRNLDIRGTGARTSALVANGAVTATDLDLTATDNCAALVGFAASQLGPGVTATASPDDTNECITAGVNAADIVTGVTVNAPDGQGIGIVNGATVTESTVYARFALELGGGTVRRSTLNGTQDGLVAYALGPTPGVVSDSVITSTADVGGAAVFAESVNVFPLSLRLRNVTAIASGADSTGLDAQAQSNSSATPGAIDARNVIARGAAHDVFAQPGSNSGCGTGCASGRVTIGYSNFRSADGAPDTSIGHNQSADPLLVNPVTGAGQDFHIASASSPLIGAGTSDPNDGPSDRGGVPHPDPPAIGAYEYPVSPGVPPGTSPPAGAGVSTTNTGPGGGSVRPTISNLTESNAVFAVAGTSTPLKGRTAAASRKRGTIFSFRLDQPATATVLITTSTRCRHARTGMRPNPSCVRMVTTLTRGAHTGLNKLPFSGRIHATRLRPGDYRAVFTATSASGSSRPKTLRFRIVGR